MSEITQQKGATQRVAWVDCAKAVAIIAVAVDHCNGLLYHNQLIAYASYFAVTLFTLLAGFSICLAYQSGKVITFQSQLIKVGKYFCQYALATCLVLTITDNRFDLSEAVWCVLNFSASGPFYFFLFFFQLMLIAPFLLSWCIYCTHKTYSALWHLITIVMLCHISHLSIQYTFILPVHGGGQFLFGGTYLLVYYLGILIGCTSQFKRTTKNLQKQFIMISILWVIQLLLNYYKLDYIDRFLVAYWGGGFNPPSLQLIVFGLTTFYLMHALFYPLEISRHKIGNCTIKAFVWVGRSTMYIFLYHLLVKDVLARMLVPVLSNIWLLRVCIFPSMIIFPVLIVKCIQDLCRKYKLFQTHTKEAAKNE